MAHEVENMFYVNEVPWHGLGTQLNEEITATEALEVAGLDWQAELRPIFTAEGDECKNHKAVVRNKDGKVLGVVGNSYHPLQNELLAELADAFSGDEALCHSAGSLREGKRVWFLLKLKGDIELKDSPIERYLLLSNSHDGSQTCRILFTPVRVVCANTLSFAIRGANTETTIRIRHTASAEDKVKAAIEVFKQANDYYSRFEELAKRMQETEYTTQQMEELAEHLVPYKPKKKVDSAKALTDTLKETVDRDKAMGSLLNTRHKGSILNEILDATAISNGTEYQEIPTRIKNKREEMVRLFNGGTGNETVQNTAWAAINAVAEYTDHARSGRKTNYSAEDNRLNSIWFGGAQRLKEKAMAKIMEQVDIS